MSVPYSRYIFQPIPWYSFLIVLGAALAIWLASREEKRVSLPEGTIVDLSLWVLPFGIIGARIYYVVFSWDSFRNDFWSVFRIWEGGIAIYGAVLGGLLAAWIFSRKRKIPLLLLCDLIAPGLILAQAIGRWGNYFNMEAYGPAVTDPALCFFPFAVQIPGESGFVWHMATFFYESCWNLLVFLALMIGRRKWFRAQGDVFFFYAFLYGAGRLVIEDFRMDSLYAASGVRVSQLLSLIVCMAILLRQAGLFSRQMSAEGGYRLPLQDTSGKGRRLPSRRPLRIPAKIALALTCLFALVILGYTLCLPIPGDLTLGRRFLLLGSFSLLMIVTMALVYGPSAPEEVLYALRDDASASGPTTGEPEETDRAD